MGRGLLVVAALGVLAWRVPPAGATMTSASTTNTGSSCGASDADGSCLSSSAFSTPNNGTAFTARYAWNVNADIGIFSTRDISGSARHNVAFTATAPGGYRLDISTARRGEIDRLNDLAGCSGSADTTGVTGSSNITLNSGTLSLADPGSIPNGGSDVNTVINQSSTATIFRSSNGVGQSHSLSFTWSGSVRSNSCEAAVRQGESSGTTTGCSVCGYPGSPSRTASNDGHFVTVTFTSLCGNGTIDGAVSEQCDQGSANGSFASCCNTNCTFKSAGNACRASAGGCDPAESCPGNNANCPADAVSTAGTVCRASAGVCDVTETCNGVSTACPVDAKSTAECRPVAGPCDLGETCNGTSNTCPPDGFFPPILICRGASGACDAAETCTGTMAACPPDGVKPAGTQCRAPAGTCDIAESCDGITKPCPIDLFALPTVQCRAVAGTCDVAETCPGTGPSCPPDVFQSATVQCRGAAGICDVAESCTGTGPNCPPDSVAGAFVGCRAAAGDCDLAENCDGVNTSCPPDAFKSSSVQCRASAGSCDVAESCTGSSATCPVNGFQPATTQCRASVGACDVAESCTGSSAACPADAVAPASTPCRPAAGTCDVAESCNGSSSSCPADAFLSGSTECRAAGGVCDVAETCTGTGPSCPADQKSTAVCRATVGACDLAETCDGVGNACPADALAPLGTTCRAAAGTCDVAESCTGLTATCPPDLVLPDGTVCNDNNSCSSPDTCEGGVCVGDPQPDSCADDFLCYKVKGSFAQILGVHLVDQFEDVMVDLRKLKHLCTPADKNSGTVFDAVTHLQSYSIKAVSGTPSFVRRHVRIDNQFGQLFVDVYKRDLLLVPTNKSLSGPTTAPDDNAINVDHYKCYKAKTTPGQPRFTATTVTVDDQFIATPKSFSLRKLKHVCTPVSKNGEATKNDDAHLACYQAKKLSGQPKHVRQTGVNTNNQLGPLVLGTVKESELCIPSLKTVLP